MIRFCKRVEEINFDFAKSETSWNISDLLEQDGVKEAIRECKVMSNLSSLPTESLPDIIKEFPFLEDIDLSNMPATELISVGEAVEK